MSDHWEALGRVPRAPRFPFWDSLSRPDVSRSFWRSKIAHFLSLCSHLPPLACKAVLRPRRSCRHLGWPAPRLSLRWSERSLLRHDRPYGRARRLLGWPQPLSGGTHRPLQRRRAGSGARPPLEAGRRASWACPMYSHALRLLACQRGAARFRLAPCRPERPTEYLQTAPTVRLCEWALRRIADKVACSLTSGHHQCPVIVIHSVRHLSLSWHRKTHWAAAT